MADLRVLVEGLGYGDVRTLLNSGNVLFSASAATAGNAASRIEESLATKLGVSARVTMLTAAELAGIVVENPMLGIADDPALARRCLERSDRSSQARAAARARLGSRCPGPRPACRLRVVLFRHPRKPPGPGRRAGARQRRDHPELGNDLEAPCAHARQDVIM